MAKSSSGRMPWRPSAKDQPVADVIWVPLEKTEANNWNPNSVAPNEMRLLYHSIRADGYCVGASTPILCADLLWRSAGELGVGDELVAFEAEKSGRGNHPRHYDTAEVTFNELRETELLRVVTDCGEVLTTPDHPWLGQRMYGDQSKRTIRWFESSELRTGDLLVYMGPPWERDCSYMAGWLSGFLDGEGSVDRQLRSGQVYRLSASQRPGPTADKMIDAITSRVRASVAVQPRKEEWSDMTHVRVAELWESMRLLGSVRPDRLMESCGRLWEGVSLTKTTRRAKVLAVEQAGTGQIASLATTSLTYIANGFAMHNTQPCVVFYDEERDKYVIIDGFHRRQVMIAHRDIRERTRGLLPVVVIDKPKNEAMASTVRHNRARGKHSVGGMANVVFGMLDGGWSDEEIAQQLGMEADELVRLKHITGFAKLFENVEYKKAWMTKRQLRIRQEHQQKEASDG